MKIKILTFGEIIWDVYENESLIGGAGLNFAAHSSKCGAESFLFSAVGSDDLGDAALEFIEDFNVNYSFVKGSEKLTGRCIVTLNEDAVPNYNVLENSAFDNITISDEDIIKINEEAFDVLYFGTLIQRNSVSRNTLKKLCESCTFKEIVCDVNLRKNCYDKDSAEFCLKNATILKRWQTKK